MVRIYKNVMLVRTRIKYDTDKNTYLV
jgi:hypothetical protein